jgi:hypothetical protein
MLDSGDNVHQQHGGHSLPHEPADCSASNNHLSDILGPIRKLGRVGASGAVLLRLHDWKQHVRAELLHRTDFIGFRIGFLGVQQHLDRD